LYTVIGPLQLGALIAENPAALKPIEVFGWNLGRAFQIHDDWLNVFSAKTGKELGGDILEGKRTLLLIHLAEQLEKAKDFKNLEYVRKLFSTPRDEKSQKDVDKMIKLYEKYGCKEWVRSQARKFADDALSKIDDIPYSPEGKAILMDAVQYIVNREH
jgi:geranylgeranyl diphosphate synthase type II